MSEESFLNKVYDSYIKDDYTYGDDNLNPKREIRKDKAKDIEASLKDILDKVNAKVDEIASRYPESKIALPKIQTNLGGAGKLGAIPPSLKLAVNRAGGSGSSLFGIDDMLTPVPPSPITNPLIPGGVGPNDYISDIEYKIGSLLPTIITQVDKLKANLATSPGTSLEGLNLYDINCAGTTLVVGTGEDSDLDSDGLDEGDESESNEDESNVSSSNGASAAGGAGGGSGNGTANDALTQAVSEGYAKTQKNITKGNVDAMKCAIKDLSLLKAFLAILKIIQTIKKCIQPALSIAIEIIQIIVLAAGCWVNPTAAGEIMQRIVQKLIAIIIMIIINLLQMLWDLLGLDCLTTLSKSLLDQIRSTMAGLNSVVSSFDAFAVSLGNDVEKLADAFEMAKEELEKAMSDLDMKELAESTKDGIKKVFSKENLWETTKDEALSQAMQTKQYNDIMSTVNRVKSLEKMYKKIEANILKTGKDSNETVQKIAKQFKKVEAK